MCSNKQTYADTSQHPLADTALTHYMGTADCNLKISCENVIVLYVIFDWEFMILPLTYD